MLKRTPIFIAILLLLLMQVAESSCQGAKPLDAESIAVPSGRYQIGVDINHQCRVNMSVPDIEPVLVSTIRPESKYLQNVLADSEAGIWYTDGPPGESSTNRIRRLKSNGTLDWEKELLPAPKNNLTLPTDLNQPYTSKFHSTHVSPAIACEGAVIIWVGDFVLTSEFPGGKGEITHEQKNNAHLECLDLKGATLWRTGRVKPDRMAVTTWRVSDDRVVMPTDDHKFEVYSILDGKHIKTVSTPGWPANSVTGPIGLDDGGWILHGDAENEQATGMFPFIYRTSPNGSYSWKNEYPEYSFSKNLTIGDDGAILYGNREGTRLIDPNDGSAKWFRSGGICHAAGETFDGNYLVIGTPEGKGVLQAISPHSNILWSVRTPYPCNGDDDVIILKNGIMEGDGNGIKCLDNSGKIKWVIDLADLGVLQVTDDTHVGDWKLNPTPEGGLVASGNDPSSSIYSDMIFIFAPGKLSQ